MLRRAGPPRKCKALLQSLLTKIKNLRPNAQVIVASLIRRTDNANSKPSDVVQQRYSRIVAAQGANFHFVDMHAVLQPATWLTEFIQQGGYDKMADAWITRCMQSHT